MCIYIDIDIIACSNDSYHNPHLCPNHQLLVLLQAITDGGPSIRFPGGKLIRVRRPNVGCAASMIDFAHEEIPISPTKL